MKLNLNGPRETVAFLLSVVACGEKLSPEEEQEIRAAMETWEPKPADSDPNMIGKRISRTQL